jgi:hypothetical protein
VRRKLLEFGPSRVFGLEETLLERPRRYIRVKAIEPSVCLFTDMNTFE